MEQTRVKLMFIKEDEKGRYFDVIETASDGTEKLVSAIFVANPLTPEQTLINKQTDEIKELKKLNRNLEREKNRNKPLSPFVKPYEGCDWR